MSPSKCLMLRASDGEEFVVKESAAIQCQSIKNMVEDDCDSDIIPVPNVDSKTLTKILEYCNKHDDNKIRSDNLKTFDSEFLDVDTDFLYELIMASNYLNIQELLDKLLEKVASLIRGKTPEQIRATFKIENDFSPEEEKEIREKNSWAFD